MLGSLRPGRERRTATQQIEDDPSLLAGSNELGDALGPHAPVAQAGGEADDVGREAVAAEMGALPDPAGRESRQRPSDGKTETGATGVAPPVRAGEVERLSGDPSGSGGAAFCEWRQVEVEQLGRLTENQLLGEGRSGQRGGENE